MPLSIISRRQAAVQIFKSISKSKYNESEILKKEFSDVLGIIIDLAKDVPKIPVTITDPAKSPFSYNPPLDDLDSGLFFYTPNLTGTPLSHRDLWFNSRNVAASLHNDMEELYEAGFGELDGWSDMYEINNFCWGFTNVWTTGDLTALALTTHSRSATNNEILTTEFIALYRIAFIAWDNDSNVQQRMETKMMKKQSPQPRRLSIRLISIHSENVRILNTIFTEEYFNSLKKDSPPSSSKLHIYIKSISVAEYNEPEMKDFAQQLLNTKEQVGPLEAIYISPGQDPKQSDIGATGS